MQATQVPILINNATTGHKLQGSSVDSLFVHNWSYVTIWVYVMLSRVRTRAGPFCTVESPPNATAMLIGTIPHGTVVGCARADQSGRGSAASRPWSAVHFARGQNEQISALGCERPSLLSGDCQLRNGANFVPDTSNKQVCSASRTKDNAAVFPQHGSNLLER